MISMTLLVTIFVCLDPVHDLLEDTPDIISFDNSDEAVLLQHPVVLKAEGKDGPIAVSGHLPANYSFSGK